jgi:pyruvate formate lyase activating enzyme
MDAPLIFEIKGNALDDGPGIRTVVFFKGCPLACAWCHNPEGMRAAAELSFHAETCVGCDSCLDVCPEGALARIHPMFVDREKCTLCFTCTEICPAEALTRVGREMSVADVAARVLRDQPFFATSGGGVTLSGGEPTLFMDFAAELARECRAGGVHVLIETCGLFAFDRFAEILLPHLDAIYFDLKLIDRDHHKQFCGTDNGPILANFAALQKHAGERLTLLPRVPLVPGITDTENNLTGIAAFLRETGAARVALLPYHPLWRPKLGRLGSTTPREVAGDVFSKNLPRETLERCREAFAGFEIVDN